MSAAVRPYGTWSSAIDASALVAGAVTLGGLVADGGDLCWLRSVPEEGGRNAIFRRTADGDVQEISPPDFNARTQVHEYGGGAMAARDGLILACSWDDQRVHRIDPVTRSSAAVTVAPTQPRGRRWAAMSIAPGGGWFLAVRETHGADRDPWPEAAVDEARNEIVRVDVATGEETVLVSGRDFVGDPWLSPDGDQLAWLAWDHPEMPWDAAELHVAEVRDDGRVLGTTTHVAGGLATDGPHRASSVADAAWLPDGSLVFAHDPDGWWLLYCRSGEDVSLLEGADHEHWQRVDAGMCRWQHGMRTLVVTGAAEVLTVTFTTGIAGLRRADGTPLTDAATTSIADVVALGDQIALLHAGPETPSTISLLDPVSGSTTILDATEMAAGVERFAVRPTPVAFPTGDGEVAHALFYPPHHPEVDAPDDEQPPLIVMTHGGPTGMARLGLSASTLYWTSRGFAVADVNYRGSAGFGRAYRDALRGRWGISDVEDVVGVVRHLGAEGLADPERAFIRGGSAGGYTTLMALCTTDVFAGGCSLFGVGDLAALARDTHKFESRYLDGLVAPWPDEVEEFNRRSPVNLTDTLSTPMLVLQGDEDEVVPPSQAEAMVAALEAKGVPHAYILFTGEQHGFRKAEHIIAAREAELAFYGHVLDIETDPAMPLEIRAGAARFAQTVLAPQSD